MKEKELDDLEMISGFRHWLEDNESRLSREGIQIEILGQTPYVPSSIHVTLKMERYEGHVQLWEDGQSEFYFLDWKAADRDLDYQPEVVHHDFSDKSQMYAALEQLVGRLSLVMA